MGIYIRCPKCHKFVLAKNKECTGCQTSLKNINSYYVRLQNGNKRNFEYAGYNITQAKAYETKRKYEIKTGISIENKSMLFSDYVENVFIPHYEAKNKSPEKEYSKFNAIEKAFENKFLNEIKPQDIDDYYQLKLKTSKPATATNHLAIIRRMFNYAVEMELIPSSPVKTKPVKYDNKRIRHLTEEEKARLLYACKESKNKNLYPIVLIALNTGMRLGEIKLLKPEDISEDVIIIRAENTKTTKMRIIPLTNALKDLFKNLTEFDFNMEIKKSFHTALKRAGITDFRFHDLRHTFASDLVMKGVDLYTVAKLLGHSTIEMTQRYSHLTPTALINAVEKLN